MDGNPHECAGDAGSRLCGERLDRGADGHSQCHRWRNFRASIVQVDEMLDVAVVKLRTGSFWHALRLQQLAAAEGTTCGKAQSQRICGEPLMMWGFPTSDGEPLRRLDGLVVGVLSEAQASDQARILTSFEAEGDYFGWIATNSIGELVGIARPPSVSANFLPGTIG